MAEATYQVSPWARGRHWPDWSGEAHSPEDAVRRAVAELALPEGTEVVVRWTAYDGYPCTITAYTPAPCNGGGDDAR